MELINGNIFTASAESEQQIRKDINEAGGGKAEFLLGYPNTFKQLYYLCGSPSKVPNLFQKLSIYVLFLHIRIKYIKKFFTVADLPFVFKNPKAAYVISCLCIILCRVFHKYLILRGLL